MSNLLTQRRILRPRFDPRSTSGLALWFDGADASSITLATGVSQWADKSGKDRHLVQADTTKQPVYSSSYQIGGITCPRFDGSNDIMSASAFTINQPLTAFLVIVHESISGNRIATDGVSSKNSIYSGSGSARLFAGTDLVGGAISANRPYIKTAVFNGASSSLRVNRVASASGNAGTQGLVNGLVIGAANNGAGPIQGPIGEYIAYDRILAMDEITQIENYLSIKWGAS